MSSPSRSTVGIVCKILGFSALLSLLFISGCFNPGANQAIAVSITSPTSQPQNLDQGKTIAITATAANDTANAGVSWAITSGLGTLSAQSINGSTYNAPTLVTTNSSVVVTAKSISDTTQSAPLNINLVTPPAITTLSMPAGMVGAAYSSTVTMTGGVSPYTWMLVAGPAGLSLGASTTNSVSVQGAPTTAGANQAFTIKVTDAQGLSSTSSALTVTVLAAAPVITSFGPAAATVTAGNTTTLTGVFANGTGSVNNGVGPVTSGSPVLVSPAATTTYTLTVVNTAAPPVSVTMQTTVTVVPAPVITSFTPGSATILAGNSTTLTPVFSGGTGSVNNGVGTVTSGTAVTVTPAATMNYILTVTNAASTSVTSTQTITVNTPAHITSTSGATFIVNSAGTFTVTTTGSPAPALTEVGALPNLVTFVDNHNGTATITGIPATGTAGNYPITITAHNGAGTDATQVFTLAVVLNQAPGITSGSSTSFTVSAAGTFTVSSTGSPTPTLTKAGALPTGVTFTDNGNGTATIAGTPAAGTTGAFPITITANNGVGNVAQQTFTLNVVAAPVITSFTPTSVTITVGNSTPLTPVFSGGSGSVNNSVGTVTTNTAVSVSPASTTTYTLTVTNAAGASVTSQALVTVVLAPVATSLTPGSASISAGASTTLTAVFTNGSGSVNNGVGTVVSGTAVNISPATTTTYTLTVTNAAGSTATRQTTVTVTSNPPLVITSSNSTTIVAGSGAAFTVTTTGTPIPTVTEVGALPTGVTFLDNHDGTAEIGGYAATGTAGSYPLTITAHNGISPDAVQSFTLTVITSPASVFIANGTVPGPVFSSGNLETFQIVVANDQAGDVLTPTLTVGGAACTTTTCGTMGSVTGTSGSGSYNLTYTPPTSANLVTTQTFTLVISSSIVPSFASTTTFNVYPAGTIVVLAPGPGARVQLNTAGTINLVAMVYNDVTQAGATFSMLASGYACPPGTGGTVCGFTSSGGPSFGTTSTATTGVPFTRYAFGYRGPSAVPAAPYDRPMILVVSNADNTKLAQSNFQINPTAQGNLFFPNSSRLNTALTGGGPITLTANLTSEAGPNKTANWTLQSGGTNCQPTCGVLGTPTYTWNGQAVTATITYTPPAAVPGTPANAPTIAATSVDYPTATDSFTFNIVNGTCGSTNNAALTGQYAFLLKGGGAAVGYESLIGSFTANGSGGITSGLMDINATTGTSTGLAIVPAGSSYSVGSDGRGCLTLVNSAGATLTYRIAVGTVVSGVATAGQMVSFGDNTGSGPRLEGVLMQQVGAPFSNSSLSGNYVFGDEGIDSNGGRTGVAGVTTASGSTGLLSNFDTDTDDNGNLDTNDISGSGTYSVAPSGRGNGTLTRNYGFGNVTANSVFYMVSTSEVLSMSSDPLGQFSALVSGEYKKQTVASFNGTELNNNGYVFYVSSVDQTNGGNDVVLGQTQFTTSSNVTVTSQENDNGTLGSPSSGAGMSTIAPNGRMTIAGGTGPNPPVFYLTGASGGFIVGSDTSDAPFGHLEEQTGGPFGDSSVSGQFFVGSDAPTTGASTQVASTTLSGTGTLTGTSDGSSSSGLTPNKPFSAGSTYSFSTSSTPVGQGNTGTGTLAYVVSGSRIIFIDSSSSAYPSIWIVQK